MALCTKRQKVSTNADGSANALAVALDTERGIQHVYKRRFFYNQLASPHQQVDFIMTLMFLTI